MHRRNKYAKQFGGKDEPRLGRRPMEMDKRIVAIVNKQAYHRIRELEAALREVLAYANPGMPILAKIAQKALEVKS